MTAEPPPLHPIFTPTAISSDSLDAATVGREDVIERVAQRVRDAARSTARRHSLLVGARGSGKTHTLTVGVHRALIDPEVAEAVALAWIPEDSLGIGSYRDLLAEVVRSMDPGHLESAQRFRRAGDIGALEALVLKIAGPRAVVLVLENLNRVFGDVGTRDSGALRGFVETSGKVLVLASTPLLFSGVTKRSEPWYGSFDVEHLTELSASEGSEIVRRRALQRSNPELAAFVMSAEGQARMRAVAHLAGGSPRLWQILAEAVTVASLDQLVPAVERLLDDLAPYYQQRLWDLGGNDQRLVLELGRAAGAVTVGDLSGLTGIDERAAATALGRLAEASWVKATKAAGGDRRKSWYELREPLLRHHLQYRDSRGEPLRVIVEVLRGWYSPQERRQQLAHADRGSVVERFLSSTMVIDPPSRSDIAYAERDVDGLMAEVRCWRLGTSASAVVGSVALAEQIELAISQARTASEEDPTAAVGQGLVALLRERWSDRDRHVLELISTCWEGQADPAAASQRLAALGPFDSADPLGHAIRQEVAYWTGEAGDPATARDLFTDLLPDRTRVLGPDHPDTLATRHSQAYWTGQAGDPATARDLFTDLLPDRTRVLGPDHPNTLTSRHNQADWTGQAGDPATARDLFTDLLADRTRVLGPDHPNTLTTRHNQADWTGQAGDPATARDLFTDLLLDYTRVLGPDHPNTLTTRNNQAYWTGEAGDPATARDLLTALLPDRTRVLGPDHPDTLTSRHNQAYWTGQAGDPATARDLLTALLADRTRVLGPDHPNTLTTRHNQADWTGQAGDPATARDLFTDLLLDCTRVLGPDHPNTLTTRNNQAYWTGEAGDPATARDLFTALLPDRTRVLGPDHPDTLTSRHNQAYWTGQAGDPATARDLFTALLPEQTRVLGPDHPNALASRHHQAYWTGQAGDPATARDLFTALLPDQTRVLGPDHPDTRGTLRALARLTFEAGGSLTQLGLTQSQIAEWASWHATRHELTPQEAARLGLEIADAHPEDDLGASVPVLQLLLREGHHVEWLQGYRGAGGQSSAWVDDLALALDGNPEARMRLPDEMRRLVDELHVTG